MSRAAELVAGLQARTPEARNKAAARLARYIHTAMRELSLENLTNLLNEIDGHIQKMVSAPDPNDKKGAVICIGIVCLIIGDCDNTRTRISRYANYLRNLVPSTDVSLMELAAKTVGKLAVVSGAKRAEYVEFEVKRAIEWLSVERNEAKRHAAVLILRELAVAMPTYFHQQVAGFFDHIFIAIKDPKPLIREAASKALQAALVVTAQRENAKQTHKPLWYIQCYKEAKSCLDDSITKEKGVSREDRIHSGLLILNELLRCSHAAWELKYTNLMQTLDTHQEISLTEDIVSIIPRIKSPIETRGGHLDIIGSSSNFNSSAPVVFESSVCRQLIVQKYDIICPAILNSWFSRSSHVQQILMIVLPRLAAFNREIFIQTYLPATIRHLLTTLRGREKDRNMAFTTIGLIAIAVETEIKPLVPKIMEVIKMALPSNDTPSKKKIGMDPAVFICISLLANSVKELIASDVKDMLDQIMATGLSPALTVCLREVAQTVPSVKEDISEALLNMLSVVLMNKPLLHPGLPKNLEQQMSNMSVSSEAQDVTCIVLALRTLGTFDFEGHSLLPFVKHCATHFLQNEQQEIRLEAVKTCSQLLAIPIQTKLTEQSNMVKLTVAEVLNKLLVVGITDTDGDVRYCVLASLDETFDSYLAQIENLNSLFIAMNDEILEIREIAICTIGRLSTVNPAYVIPSLRKTLIQFLTELEHSGMSRNKEQSARMLDHLIVSAPRLIRPYMEPILNVLVPKLKEPDSNLGVVLSVLRAIGDLAGVNGDSSGLNKWMSELLSILLELLADPSSPEKRSVALWTFGQLISATGQVITPYSQFPNLMDVLINFLKTEQQPIIRRETIRVLGLLGALDPYKHKITRGMIDGQMDSNLSSLADSKADENNLNMNTSEMLVTMSSSMLEEYYPAIAISTLMRIIRDPNLSQHYTSIVQAVTFIFQSLGIKCVPYISQVMPSLLHVVRIADARSRDFLFTQLAMLIAIVKQHIRNYLDKIFDLIKEFWTPDSPLQTTLILLVEYIAVALGAEFKIYLPQVIPQILKVLSDDSSKDRAVTINLLSALQKFGDNLDDYLHLILPPIVRLFDSSQCPIAVSKTAMETVDHLADSLDFTDLTSRIVHPLVRSLETCPELRPTAINTLCALVVQLGRKFNHFIPLVQKVIHKHKIPSQKYDVLISKLQSSTTLAVDKDFLITRYWYAARHSNQEISLTSNDTTTIKKLQVNAGNLRLAWTATRRVSKDDWLEWLRNLSIGLLKESQSPALRSCLALAQNYSQLLRDLFNAAFVSCWTELKDDMRAELVQALEQALTAPDLPEITQTILNLAEFMEHCDRGPLPIQTQLLGERAMHCRAYAKALHYKEEEFRRDENSHVVEALILINNKLQQREAAEGLLELVMRKRNEGRTDLQVQVRWYEKLHSWEKALHLYSDELTSHSDDIKARLGQMRCLEALGEWAELHKVAGEHWDNFAGDDRGRAGRLAAAAAWGLGNWDSMQNYVQCIPSDSQDGAFYRAVLAVHAGQFSQAQQLIEKTRDLLDTELTAMAGESYQRAYGAIVWVQMLSELEEVMQYKLVPERRPAIRSMWWARLQGGQKLVEDWQRIIRVHRLVINPRDDMHTWLKYASLCRKSGSLVLAHKTLVMLMGVDPSVTPDLPLPSDNPQITLAYCKLLWVSGKRDDALSHLQEFVDSYFGVSMDDDDKKRLLARCYLKLGAWRESIEGVTEASIPLVLRHYSSATEHAPDWYKAWHAWAYMNFETVLFYKHKNDDGPGNSAVMPGESSKVSSQYISKFAVPAVEGFFKSINLSHGNSLQDTLRLLTLWFDYGQWPEVHEAIVEGIRTIEINTWLQVIPQLIARIDTPRALGRLIQSLLIDIGKSHPQALVYPLSVASKSSFVARRNAANLILKSMCTHSANLVNQAMMASEELIRVAILWHEQWHEGLEEASRLYFGEDNINGMLEILEPLHAMLERGPQTIKETSFNQAYGRDLTEALDWCNRYKVSRKISDLNQAWDVYYHVFRRISKQLPQLTSLELQYVSPKLQSCSNLELAVPGTYRPGQEVVRIAYIQSNLQVITSKQRPRRLCIRGSNGKDYMFLLKGHEDLRQDERVMQLFGLVNTLLQNDPDTFRRNLTIQRYAVIPLSTNSGLIGWVPYCDTLHSLIRDYRERKKCLLNIEHRLMLRMTVDYDKLMLMQKVEVFEHALEHTAGDDLARLLWLKSPSSEVWFERRTNYTRSLAVMSMVGYILGLGDRHPSNLMLDRITGKILHIDFGDCFEVAVTRDKFPEKIPFRLTRMLINAMEVTGIEGTYRRTCESVMAVLHRNKDSLMAVLEAFVHDPLLNWRLMDTNRRSRDGSLGTGNSAGESASLSVPAPLPRRTAPGQEGQPEALNKKALAIINRVRDKLTGRDFNPEEALTVAKQVDLLIQQATSNENLCQCYIGWCPFW